MSSPAASVAGDSNSRRRSGRVVKKPDFLAPEASAPSKRKRATADEEVEDDEDVEDESEEEDEEEAEPAEEEVRATKARKPKNAPKRPAAKKPKTNGAVAHLPIRGTTTKARSRKKKAQAPDTADAEEAGGLYTEVFARNHALEDVVTEWIRHFHEGESEAVADLINFVLKCSGCDLKVTKHDVEDVDQVTAKLADLQEEFQAQNIVEYPIISKSKGTAAFKASVVGFFNALVKGLEASGILLTNIELVENIQHWIMPMSAASNRSFRHTATVTALAFVTAFCEVAAELTTISAKALRQSESEKKNKRVNKARVSELKDEAQKTQEKRALLDNILKDWFNVLFMHRYRDVDPKIRVDCAQALGDWIITYPDHFFSASHLRYLGWILSDTHAPARLEVVKQLSRLYEDKDNIAGLKAFTERFRPRMVEMAVQDHEPNVRAAAVELLDKLREAGFLEPDDIDAVGRLIFDAEPRVRKAVVSFFTESVNDSYESKIDDLGGLEAVDEELPDDISERPGKQWLKLKALAEMLDSYDTFDSESDEADEHRVRESHRIPTGLIESRFIIAATSLYHELDIIQDWEALAAYLLYDTSDSGQNGVAQGIESELKRMIVLSEKEEIILLEVLNASLKSQIQELVQSASERKGKKSRKEREELAGKQESTARQLANLVPRLLKRFGGAPQTASAVLRLDRIVNLEAFEDFHQDASTYTTLLDDINRQFLSHGNEEVLTEASRALLRAKDYEDLGDVTGEKIDELWEETVSTFTALTADQHLTIRGGLRTQILDGLSKTVLRLESLAPIQNPIEHLERIPAPAASGRKSKAASTPKPPIESLIELIQVGAPSSISSEDASEAQAYDAICHHAARTTSFYLLWSLSSLKTALTTTPASVPDTLLTSLATYRDGFINAIVSVISTRNPHESLCTTLTGLMLDIYASTAILRQIPASDTGNEDHLALALEMDPSVQKHVLAVLSAAEETYARRTNRTIEKTKSSSTRAAAAAEDEDAIHADPINDEESDSDSDAVSTTSSDENASSAARKLEQQLVAEKALCDLAAKIVLATTAGMMDASTVRRRLELNKTRLGNNYRAVVAYLDVSEKGGKKTKPAARAQKAKTPAPAKKAKSREVVSDDEDEEEEEAPLEEEEDEQGEGADEEPEAEVESVLGD
ncbi:hypothetical protein MBLNU457_6172t1 [Dothideomycetes sp. NU457]